MTRSTKPLLGLAVAAGMILGLLVLLREDPPQPHPQLATLEAELATLKAAMQAQRRASTPTDRRRAAGAALGDLATSGQLGAAPSDDAASAARPSEPNGPPPVTYEESQAMVLDAYGEEATDPAWSAEATHKLDTLVRQHLPNGSQLAALECRTTMCRLKVIHHDPRAQGAFLMDGFRDWTGSIFVASEEQRRNELVVTLIAAREGTEPPLGPR